MQGRLLPGRPYAEPWPEPVLGAGEVGVEVDELRLRESKQGLDLPARLLLLHSHTDSQGAKRGRRGVVGTRARGQQREDEGWRDTTVNE